MAKVKRSTPLEGGTWDLSELGTVQHTSRWGTVARAKGSTLRYYPGCPWEKKPQCLPPSQWLWEVILAIKPVKPGQDHTTRLGIAIRGPDRLCFNAAVQGMACPWELVTYTYWLRIVGYERGWILAEGETFYRCKDGYSNRLTWRPALAVPGCFSGDPPPGYARTFFSFCEPQATWWGPRTGKAWIANCGTLKNCYETPEDVPVILE